MADTRLWTLDGFRNDSWRRPGDLDAVPNTESVLLPLSAFLALDAGALRDRAGRIAVELAPGDAIDAIVAFLPELPLVALAFPAFNDGRSFSKAELLRSRHGYAKKLRATGQVLIDQLPHMLRLGFDEFEVSNPVLIARLEEGRLDGLPLFYQPSAADAPQGPGYSWRRRSA